MYCAVQWRGGIAGVVDFGCVRLVVDIVEGRAGGANGFALLFSWRLWVRELAALFHAKLLKGRNRRI
jgi:hypothetical protein